MDDEQTHLREATEAADTPPPRPSYGFWVVCLALITLAVAGFLALRLHIFPTPKRIVDFLEKGALGLGVASLTLFFYRLLDRRLQKISDIPLRYNARRVSKLLFAAILLVSVLTVLFANWYAAITSLGLLSIVLSFSLQTPLASFIGWIYILAKRPYWVGDRISIGDSSGDVIDVAYLDTTLWEIGGPMINSKHHPSGRLIKFPNSRVLTTPVINSSWSLFPYVWNEIIFQVAYDSDLEFVSQTLQ